jgi:hypothetical protein
MVSSCFGWMRVCSVIEDKIVKLNIQIRTGGALSIKKRAGVKAYTINPKNA